MINVRSKVMHRVELLLEIQVGLVLWLVSVSVSSTSNSI